MAEGRNLERGAGPPGDAHLGDEIVDLVLGDVDAGRRAELVGHLLRCAACRSEYDDARGDGRRTSCRPCLACSRRSGSTRTSWPGWRPPEGRGGGIVAATVAVGRRRGGDPGRGARATRRVVRRP